MKYFNEIQKLPYWIYILISSSFIAVLILVVIQYTKTSSSEKEELLIILIVTLILEAITLLFLKNSRQEVTVDVNGVHYRYSPLKTKEVQIPISKIKSYDCINYNSIKHGYRVGRFAGFVKTPSITMMGINKAIKLTFTDDSSLIIGTKKSEEFIQVLNQIKNRYHEIN